MSIRVTRPVGHLLLVLPLLGLIASTAAADPLYSVTDLGPMSDGLNGGDSVFGDVSSQRRLTLDDSGHVTTTTWGSPAPYSGALPAPLTEGFGGGNAVVTSTAGGNLAGWGYGENTNNLGFVTIDGATKAVTPLPGDTFTQALAVNEQGYAAGITGNASQVHPFFYSKYEGGSTSVAIPGGGPGAAYGMNNNAEGRLVGEFINPADGQRHAFLADSAYAYRVTADLNKLIAPDAGWTLKIADSINNQDQIAAFGTDARGETHALLLTPNSAITTDSIKQAITNNDGDPTTPPAGDGGTPEVGIPEPATPIFFAVIFAALWYRRRPAA